MPINCQNTYNLILFKYKEIISPAHTFLNDTEL